jgi:hypothetical protein
MHTWWHVFFSPSRNLRLRLDPPLGSLKRHGRTAESCPDADEQGRTQHQAGRSASIPRRREKAAAAGRMAGREGGREGGRSLDVRQTPSHKKTCLLTGKQLQLGCMLVLLGTNY